MRGGGGGVVWTGIETFIVKYKNQFIFDYLLKFKIPSIDRHIHNMYRGWNTVLQCCCLSFVLTNMRNNVSHCSNVTLEML